MNSYKEVRKRLTALIMCGLVTFSTFGSDLFALATEDNSCSEFVDEYTYVDGVLSPDEGPDGYCDNCGLLEVAHHIDEEVESDEIVADESTDIEDIEPAADEYVEDAAEVPADEPTEAPVDETTEAPTEDTTTEDLNGHTDNDLDGYCDVCGAYIQQTTVDETDTTDTKEPAESEESQIKDDADSENTEDIEDIDDSEAEDIEDAEEETEEEELEEEEETTLEEKTVSKSYRGTKVTVSGLMPEGATVEINPIGTTRIGKQINNSLSEGTFIPFEAYDINIYDKDGNKYQPEDDGNTVRVTFSGVDEIVNEEYDEADLSIYRVEDNTVEEIPSDVVDGNISFEAEHFTDYTTGVTVDSAIKLSSYQNFGYLATANATGGYNYTVVNGVKFNVYFDAAGSDSFTAEVYKGQSADFTEPTGNPIATAEGTVSASDAGWAEASATFSYDSVDGYISKGDMYFVHIIFNSNKSHLIKYGTGDSAAYIFDGATYARESSYDGIFTVDSTTITETNTPSDSYTIASISSKNGVTADNNKLYYSKGDTDTLIATLSATNVSRVISWRSNDESIVTVDSNGNIEAVGPGLTTIEASYNGSTKSISIQVFQINLAGTDANSGYSVAYNGAAQEPVVKLITNSSGNEASSSNVSVEYSNNTNVTTSAKVSIVYTPSSTASYTFERTFAITALTLSETDFTTAGTKPVITNRSITGFTDLPTVSGVKVQYSDTQRDFTASLESSKLENTGMTYTVSITPRGNFTGSSFTITSTSDGIDISTVLGVRDSGALSELVFTGSPVTLTQRQNASSDVIGWEEVNFYLLDGDTNVDGIVTPATATYTITDDTTGVADTGSVGDKTITFTMKEGQKYSGSLSLSFTVGAADISDASIVWASSNNGQFLHTGNPIEPVAGTDFDVVLNGYTLSTSDYTVTYQADHTSIGEKWIEITGANNYDSTYAFRGTYEIMPDFTNDLTIRVKVGNKNYDSTSSDRDTGYDKAYDTTATAPSNITVILNKTTLKKDTDYSIYVCDKGQENSDTPTLTADVGTKSIVVTGIGSYAGKGSVVAYYDVVQCNLNSSSLTITKPSGSYEKTFKGSTIELTRSDATHVDNEIKIVYGSTILDEDDYDVTYSNNYNVGTASYTITGKGNYTGSLSGSDYRFKIVAATITGSTGTAENAIATIANNSLSYDGNAKTESDLGLQVKIGNTVISREDGYNNNLENYTLTYSNNVSPSTSSKTGTVTITGKNNLTGSVIIPFTITSSTKAYDTIQIAGKTAVLMREETNGNNTVRYYRCTDLTVYYTGSAYDGAVSVTASEGTGTKTLTRNKDYAIEYVNAVNAAAYNSDNENDSPYLLITGLRNYARNNAVVFFDIGKQDLSNCTITEANNWQLAPATASHTEVAADITITNGSVTLTEGTDFTVDYGANKNVSGTDKTLTITGTGSNYTGSVTKTYTVGYDLATSDVTVANAYDETDTYSLVNGVYQTYWQVGSVEPSITISKTVDGEKLVAATIKSAETSSISDPIKYISRVNTGLDSGEVNVITVTYKPNTSATYQPFYGERTIVYKINPIDISNLSYKAGTGEGTYGYTGSDILPAYTLEYVYGKAANDDALKYDLNSTTGVSDVTPNPINIGSSVQSNVKVKLTGVGNFTGSKNLTFDIVKGNVAVSVKNGDTEHALTLSQYTGDGATSNDLTSTITDDMVEYYYNSGLAVEPNLVVKNEAGTVLTKGSDYSITYYNQNKPTTGATAYAVITIPSTSNYVARSIYIYYEIKTKSLENGMSATMTDLEYTAETMDQSYLAAKLAADSTILTVTYNGTKLKYGSTNDYVFATSADDLAAIKAAYGDSEELIGTNLAPSYAEDLSNSVNYVWIKGVNSYSGYKKVPFNIVLNLNSAYASVSMASPYYTLDSNGVPTTTMTATVKYKLSDSSYAELTDTSNYTIERSSARVGQPGPDTDLTITGQKACTGSITGITYKDASGDSSYVYFLVDLSNYSGISIKQGTLFDYTGSAVTISFDGLGNAQYNANPDTTAGGDYTVVYTSNTNNLSPSADEQVNQRTNVGTHYAVIIPTKDSQYFVYGKNKALEYKIKYNLSKATMVFNNDASKNYTNYTGSEYSILDNVKVTIASETIYDKPSGITNLVTITPETVTRIGDYTVSASALDTDKVYGRLAKTFTVKGMSLAENAQVSIASGTYTYTGSAIEPAVTVKVNGSTLVENTDYTVAYFNNVNAGTAYVQITGLGAYETEAFKPTTASNGCNGEFTIDPVPLTDSHINIVIEDPTYDGTFTDTTKSSLVYLEPSYKVYYVDTAAGINNLLQEQIVDASGNTTTSGDYKFSGYLGNRTYASATTSDTSAIEITAGNSGNTTGSTTATYTINKLNLSQSNVTQVKNTAEYTGQAIEVSDAVVLTTLSGHPLIQGTDYDVTVTKDGVNYTNNQITDMGIYTIKIAGKNSCDYGYESTFEITERSLPDNWHYYYDAAGTASGSSWDYVSGDSPYYKSNHAGSDNLDITVYDVEEFTAGTEVVPKVVIVDNGIRVTGDTTTGEGGNQSTQVTYKTLEEGVDYTLTVTNATAAGTGKWSKSLKTDSTHALPTADSPAVTITGIGNYTGSITVPFNIGKSLVTLYESSKITVQFTGYNSYADANGNRTAHATYDYGNEIKYTYNGEEQSPTPVVKLVSSGRTLQKGTDYTVSIVDGEGNTDTAVDAGVKYLVIEGIGSYCGELSQKYTIQKKAVEDTASAFTIKEKGTSWKTNNGDYTFAIVGNDVTVMDEETSQELFGTTDYAGYYYARYSGTAIEPEVRVTDNKLGPYRNKNGTVNAEKDLNISYGNSNTVSDPAAGTFGTITISFKSQDDGYNYYSNVTGGATYTIKYIIGVHDISSDFEVTLDNGLNGENLDFTGAALKPAVKVTDGSIILTEDDYDLTYSNNVFPGVATVTVTGRGNYTGTKSINFYIWGELNNDTEVAYKDDEGNYVIGTQVQQYTGTAVNPDLYLVIPADNNSGVTEITPLTLDEDYEVVNISSNDSYVSNGTVVYRGNQLKYWNGTKTVDFTISFNENQVKVSNYESSYAYTGLEIKPDFELNVGTINTIEFYRSDDLTTETDDLINIGTITARIYYSVGNATINNPIEATYTITPRDLDDCNVIVASTMKFTGRQLKPNVILYTSDGNGNVNILKKDTHYTISYGENISGKGSVVIKPVDGLESLTGSKTCVFDIKLGSVTNLQKTAATSSSISFNWANNISATGEELILYKITSSGSTETTEKVASATVTGNAHSYTFTGLSGTTNYRVAVRSFTTYNGTKLVSDWTFANGSSGISSSSITVKNLSAGSATVAWDTSGDVIIYKIYRADDSTSAGTLVAAYSASIGSFTNSGLTLNQTYYYYVVGYSIVNGQFMQVNQSEHIPVTIIM